MDLLKRELEKKKKSVQKAKSASGDGRRFFRAKDLRKLEEEEEEEKEEKYQSNRKRKSHDDTSQDEKGNESAASLKSGVGLESEAKDKLVGGDASSNHKETEKSTKKSRTDEGHEESKALKMSPEEVNERLRGLGYPIKLFGESAWDRIQRLRLALDAHNKIQADLTEKEETRLGRGHGIRNPFLEKDDNELELNANVEDGAEDGKASGDDTNNKQVENEDLDENDPHKRVYKYFKGLVKQWEERLSSRPEAVKKSVAGRTETKTFKQCKDYIRPMFKLCKNRRMDESKSWPGLQRHGVVITPFLLLIEEGGGVARISSYTFF